VCEFVCVCVCVCVPSSNLPFHLPHPPPPTHLCLQEESGRAALLLEQAAYSLLCLRQPSVRKFAFHMVLAGLRFHSCGQKRLAMQAYK
jgi:hypothetical protein